MVGDQCCTSMTQAISDDDYPIHYRPRFRTWILELDDGSSTPRRIDFCPWCGVRLPPDLGEQRHQEVVRRGLDPLTEDDDLPADLRDDRWWKALGL